MDERDELYLLARSDDARIAYVAVEQLAAYPDDATIQLLIDRMTRTLYYVTHASGWGEIQEHVWQAAARSIKAIGDLGIDALIDRIVSPRAPEDDVLMERSATIGRPMFELARVMVTDGDAKRARAAEAIVAQFPDLLEVEEMLGIYLAVCERERFAPRPTPEIVRVLWRRFCTAEVRVAIAARWIDRDLRDWIEGRLDRDPLSASVLFALLIAGPDDALPIMRKALLVFNDSARFTAVESMLTIDPVRAGDVFAGEPALWAWAEARATSPLRTDLHLMFVIACSRSSHILTAYAGSWELQHHPDEIVDILRAIEPANARAFRDQLVRAAAGREEPLIVTAVTLLREAVL